MQTPAEKYLVRKIVSCLDAYKNSSGVPAILNVGAGRSLSIERQLSQAGCRYLCDRIDVENCRVDYPSVRQCWKCSVEEMTPVVSGQYSVVFANYVLEHIEKPDKALAEILRALVPGGFFVASLSNPLAPEMILARHTPLIFHKAIRGEQAWETRYAYRSVSELLVLFRDLGFQLESERYWSYIRGYLYKYPLLGSLGRVYDRLISGFGENRLMGNVCIVLKKPF